MKFFCLITVLMVTVACLQADDCTDTKPPIKDGLTEGNSPSCFKTCNDYKDMGACTSIWATCVDDDSEFKDDLVQDSCQCACAADPCNPDPCQNEGTCDNGKCTCKQGFTGSFCESKFCDELTLVRDPDNDGRKCHFDESKDDKKDRVFKLEDEEASEEECVAKCEKDKDCVAFSAIFGKWCIGCDTVLEDDKNDDHDDAIAYVKRPAGVTPFRDYGNDGRKCQFENKKYRTFDLRDDEATYSACLDKCATDDNCVAFSAIFGDWCIGCGLALDNSFNDDHKGAIAYRKCGAGRCDNGYYECEKCCDFNPDCKCDQTCDESTAPNGICSYVP